MSARERIAVLFVEDDTSDAEVAIAQLGASSSPFFEVEWSKELESALRSAQNRAPDVILLDLGLAGVQGLEALAALRAAVPQVPVVVLTGQSGEEVEVAVLTAGADDFLVKGRTHPGDLCRALRFAVERQRRESRRLSESQERMGAIFDASPEAIALESAERLVYVNPAFVRLYGYERPSDLIGRHIAATLAPDDVEKVLELGRARIRGEAAPSSYEFTGLRRDGSSVEIAAAISTARIGETAFIISIERDITRHRELEAQLRQGQRMEAVGRLAGGIAHDFNNLLTAITGFGQLTLEALAADDPLRRNLDEIRVAAERAAELTRQLLAFSRQQILQPRVIDLNAVLEQALEMLRRVIGEDVAIETLLAGDLGQIRADTGQVVQVLLNLVVNARDAMPQGGRLTIRTSNRRLGAEDGNGFAVVPGEYVELEVADNGIGMSDDVRARLFDPFFTTKEVGKGTGLGLSTVYGIVKQSGGYIWVESEPGLGARFHICFPCVAAEIETGPPASVPPPQQIVRGDETILVVEDESAVRALVRTVLRSRGYRVLVAGSGREALETIARHDGTIDLLFTDVVMPEMSGRELARQVTARYPNIRVLFMSGYATDVIAEGGLLDAGVHFLQKPFGPELLSQTVRSIFESG
jgi:two-component system cell cycle sensor histidine kinase/response regulator CckA